MNRSRDQSTDDPSLRIWLVIVPRLLATHSHTRASKASRPTSWRDFPSAANCFSTTFWVAMPAWSVPGSQSTS